MNLQQLEYFKTISKTKNFTTASNELLVTQPALSKAISKLENELDVDLFERDGRNVKVTKYGEVFLKYAQLALNNIEEGIKVLNNMKEDNEKNITIASSQCTGSTFVPFVLSGFLNQYPDTKFQFNNSKTEEILKGLNNNSVDIGFLDSIDDIYGYMDVDSFLVKKEKYVLVVPRNHHLASEIEVSLKDLKEESFIVSTEECRDKLISYNEILGYTPKISIHLSEVNMLGGLLSAGLGIAIVPNTPLINTNKISIVNIKEDIGYKSIYIVWNKKFCKANIVNKFKEYIIENSEA